MPTPIVMPKLGMTMTEGRVLAWCVAVGEPVERGRPLLRIESEKTEVEVEAPVSGILRHVYVPAGEAAPCGGLLAALTATADEPFDVEAFRLAHAGATTRLATATPPAPPGPPPPSSSAPARPPVTPAARALARDLGIDPTRVPGSGPGGRVLREDVERFAAAGTSRVAVAPDVVLEVPAVGAGSTVLLLPGFGTDVSMFAPQTAVLRDRFRVLGVNPRGVGGSTAPEDERYAVPTLATDAAAVIGTTSAHVVGASLGAAVALELALAHPGRVQSLVLVTPFLTASPRLVAVLEAWVRIAAEATPATLAVAVSPWLFAERTLADAAALQRLQRGFAAAAARIPPATLARTAAGLRAWSGTRTEAVRRLAVPTLVVAAEADLLVPDAAAVAAAVPGATCRVVPGAGHAVTLDAPDAVTAALTAHLARVGS